VDMWAPLAAGARNAKMLVDPTASWFVIWARVHPDTSPARLAQMLQPAYSDYRRGFARGIPPEYLPRDRVEQFVNAPLQAESAATGNNGYFRLVFSRPLWILAILAGLLLLICCSNLANLYAARAAAREREMAMRLSIGAGRWRLIRQLLIESSLVAGASCALALAFARAAAPAVVSRLSPTSYPAYLDLHLQWRTIAFVALAGIVSMLVFGVVPAFRASGVSPHETLKTGGGNSRRAAFLHPLLAAQVAFSFVVLFLGGLLLLSFQRLANVDPGFSSRGVALYRLRSKVKRDADQERLAEVRLLDELHSLPGVEGAGLSQVPLLAGDFGWVAFNLVRVPGRPEEPRGPRSLGISPGFLDAMRIRLVAGRDFDARDVVRGGRVLVNESFAAHYFPAENPIGKRFEWSPRPGKWDGQEIVGVITDIKYNNLREPPTPSVYFPIEAASGATLAIRTASATASNAPALRRAIQNVDPNLTVDDVVSQTTQIENTIIRERLLALLAGFFTLVAMALAAVGLYGVLSYALVRRTKEIGIRVALGARPAAMARLIVTRVALATAVGAAAGGAGAFELARFLESFLFEVKPADPFSQALPVALLLAAAAIAVAPPAWRAARVDPLVALREE
ncbi:MAG TPA: FtsX-like permease family protein, partial [Bryobacteraceae bacterium]